MIPRVEKRQGDASLLAGAFGDSRPVPHEQVAIFEENERIANVAGLRECEARSNPRGIITTPEKQPFPKEMSELRVQTAAISEGNE